MNPLEYQKTWYHFNKGLYHPLLILQHLKHPNMLIYINHIIVQVISEPIKIYRNL